MRLKQLLGFGKFTYKSLSDFPPLSIAIFGLNYYKPFARELLAYEKKIYPNSMGIEITNHCTKNCAGCYIPHEMRMDETVMDEGMLLSAIYQAKGLKIRNIGFFGGEPVSEKTIPLIKRSLSDNPFLSFICCTNGDYIAENGLPGLEKNHNLGLCLSLDGFRETNDGIRGRGSYDKTLNASKELRRIKKIFSALTTVRKENAHEVLSEDFVNHLADNNFRFVTWTKYGNPHDSMSEVPDREFVDMLKMLRKKTMTKPIYQKTDVVTDMIVFDPLFNPHSIYLGLNGDIRLQREDMSTTCGNLKEKSMEEIFRDLQQEYQEKYSFTL